jgi:hypothetical protein
MKNTFKIAAGLVFLIALYFAFFGKHNPFSPEIKYINGKPYEVIKHEIDTIDIVKTKVVEKKGEDIYHDTTIFVQVPMNVDTMEIIKQYFAKNVFKDTLHLPDSLGYVAVQDTISKNKIESRKYSANVKQRTIKETTIVKELPKAQLYWGIGLGLDKVNYVNNVNANLLLKSKCDRIYGLGAGVDINKTPFVNASIYWKIK